MHLQRDIKFTTSQTATKLTEGKVCYQGQLIHNQTLDADSTREDFAKYANLNQPMANLAIDSIAGFIEQEIAKGNRIDFGSFSVGLKLRGGFTAANSPFDKKVNELAIEMTPSKALKKAVRYLNPINATPIESSRISCAGQYLPSEMVDAFDCCGTRELYVGGVYICIHPDAIGEGVWIENDAGVKLLQGEVIYTDYGLCKFRLTDAIAPGLYWLVLCSRRDGETELRRVQRRITAK